jgi:hypothetical protein
MEPEARNDPKKVINSMMGFGSKSITLLLVFFALGFFLKADESTEQHYFPVYLDYLEGEGLEKQNDFVGALVEFKSALLWLQKIHERDVQWEQTLVLKKIQDCQEQIANLEPLALKQVRGRLKNSQPTPAQMSGLFDEAASLEGSQMYGGAIDKLVTYVTTVGLLRQAESQWDTPAIAEKCKQAQAAIDRLLSLEIEMLLKSERGDGGAVQ